MANALVRQLRVRSVSAFLATCLIVIVGYTSITIANHGANLLPVFFGDMAKMAWPGQFNLDFMLFLMLAGIWVGWRHHFSVSGLALGVVAVFGGMLFLSAYLLVHSFQTQGDVKALLLGETRVGLPTATGRAGLVGTVQQLICLPSRLAG